MWGAVLLSAWWAAILIKWPGQVGRKRDGLRWRTSLGTVHICTASPWSLVLSQVDGSMSECKRWRWSHVFNQNLQQKFCRGYVALVKCWMNRTNQIQMFENGTAKGNNFTELVLSLSINTSFPLLFLRCSVDSLVKGVTMFHPLYRRRCWSIGGYGTLCCVR